MTATRLTVFSLLLLGRAVQESHAFSLAAQHGGREASTLFASQNNNNEAPLAQLRGFVASEEDRQSYESALQQRGFSVIEEGSEESLSSPICVYKFHAASGMLQLVVVESTAAGAVTPAPPRWVPIVREQENVLVANGWSFLDVDESEAMSAFDVDAANSEGTYQPKWSRRDTPDKLLVSQLGFSIFPMTSEQVLDQATYLTSDLSKQVLLEGATDPPYQKVTHNGCDWNGSVATVPPGIFTCAIGGLPLFSTVDLMPSTASAGWFSFARPIATDHVCHVEPEFGGLDRRTEVICAKSGCHLGHCFGADGYCINASCLNFLSTTTELNDRETDEVTPFIVGPISYRSLELDADGSPTTRLLRQVLQAHVRKETLVLGAGCFWHVEFAFRRLPGVFETTAGYSGGSTPRPSYEQVCQGGTGHAEVVKVDFDPQILHPLILLDCFLALHDPTKVRAHGKHAAGRGQYRSSIFLPSTAAAPLKRHVEEALTNCQEELEKDLSTEVAAMLSADSFYPAEERHQRHDERRKEGDWSVGELSTLSPPEWIALYGRRQDSVLGSATTINRDAGGFSVARTADEAIAEARFMI
jgi:peptide-methionine (S)-S-oxide reductase